MSEVAAASEDGALTIWQELDKWAQEFKPWQRYILAHAVRERTLSETRLDEAHSLMLSEHGLKDATGVTVEVPSSITGRPVDPNSAMIHISRVFNLASINALPSTAELTFSPGLTVIYGANGTGKSGFARIFSNACFSRAQHKILPDIGLHEVMQPVMSADISFGFSGENHQTFKFDATSECPELKRIAVFDSAVARVHLTTPNPFSFKPVGFDVFPEMARCYDELTRRVDTELAIRQRENVLTRSFATPETEVSKLVVDLKFNTDLTPIRAHAQFGLAEISRAEEVQRQIGEIQAQAIPAMIEQLEQNKAALKTLSENLALLEGALGEAAREAYKIQLADVAYRNRVVTEQGAASFKTELLKSIGSYEWESFIAFARDLAKSEGDNYPRDGDVCLLCQQPLDNTSHALIHRIWEFLASEAHTKAREAEDLLHKSIESLESLKTNFFADNTSCYACIKRSNSGLAEKTSALVELMTGDYYKIHGILCDAISMGRDGNLPDISWHGCAISEIKDDVSAQLEQLDLDIARVRDNDPKDALETLQTEHRELAHRQVLNQLLPDIEKYVEDLVWIEAASGPVKRSLNSRHLTAKETDLFTKVVASDYRRQLKEECNLLSCGIPVQFKTEGQKGRTLRSLSMTGGHSPIQILSEGEQRAIALADFLTEVGLNKANAGIVLDDPVTSQDNDRKRSIAKRLAKESKSRQVIILTHDLLFLMMLVEEANSQSVGILTHWIERDAAGRPGQISLNDSPATTSQYRKTDKAKATLLEAKATVGSERVKAVQRGLAELRRTVEEIIPYLLFKQTVTRWSDRVVVGALKSINWDESLVSEIVKSFEELSAFIEGHSHTEQTMSAPPEPSDLELWIARVEGIIKRAKPAKSTS